MSVTGKTLTLPGLKAASDLAGDLTGEVVTRTVPLSAIDVMPGFNHRGLVDPEAFAPERLEGLAASIRSQGLLAPLVLRPRGMRFELVAGERRFHAARLAGLASVPAVVRSLSDMDARAVSLMENVQREGVSIVEQTIAGFELMELATGLSHGDLVTHLNQLRNGTTEDRFGLSALLHATFGTSVSTWAQTRARIMNLTHDERLAVIQRRADAKALLPLTALAPEDPSRAKLFQRVLDENLSAKEVERLVREARHAGRTPSVADELRRYLPQLTRLKGERRTRAEALLNELKALLTDS